MCTSPTLATLPLEILQSIASNLPVTDILTLTSSSRSLHHLRAIPSTWKHLDFTYVEGLVDNDFEAFLSKVAEWVTVPVSLGGAPSSARTILESAIRAIKFHKANISIVTVMKALRMQSLAFFTATNC
ncbi:hypothetical protein HDU93_000869, partial [Gonapodya sp. JEL0774]